MLKRDGKERRIPGDWAVGQFRQERCHQHQPIFSWTKLALVRKALRP